jgi:uncharacterized protein with GYD domain
MPKYIVLYRFTEQGAKNIRQTVQRARQTRKENEARGFSIDTMLWTQGPYDLVTVVDAPSEEEMMGAMMNVVSAGNVSSTTLRAFDESEMEQVLAGVGGGRGRGATRARGAARGGRTTSRRGTTRRSAAARTKRS